MIRANMASKKVLMGQVLKSILFLGYHMTFSYYKSLYYKFYFI